VVVVFVVLLVVVVLEEEEEEEEEDKALRCLSTNCRCSLHCLPDVLRRPIENQGRGCIMNKWM
jgi:hypothetical protein